MNPTAPRPAANRQTADRNSVASSSSSDAAAGQYASAPLIQQSPSPVVGSAGAVASPTQPSPLNPNWSGGGGSQSGGASGVHRSGSGGSMESSSEESAQRLTHQQQQYPNQPNPYQRRARDAVSQGVATNAIGSAYGPYSYQSIPTAVSQSPLLSSSHTNSRFSSAPSDTSLSSYAYPAPDVKRSSAGSPSLLGVDARGPATGAQTTTLLLWDEKDPEMDDALHRPDPPGHKRRGGFAWSTRGCINMSALFVLMGALITLFAGYPIISWYRDHHRGPISGITGFNLGGINGSGQVPSIPNLPSMIDKDTPASAYSRTGYDGKTYNLVFSDEFEEEGRTFFPGDDPYWEAVDFHYWPTADFQWYSPRAATTKGGSLVLTMTERESHGMNFESAMLQSWNKFCFTGGYFEVSVALPGNNIVGGYWPGVWLMGNLGRPGYGATTEGVWPYSYDTCDVGTFKNQTYVNGTGPQATLTTGWNDGPLSFLPGQKFSSCTCKNEDHPGPNVGVGRGAPEIDILEGQVDVEMQLGQMSQSVQFAPFDAAYEFDKTKTTTYNSAVTKWNGYSGGPFQQAVSGLSYVNTATAYGGAFQTYGVEYYSDKNDPSAGRVTWQVGGDATWTLEADAVGPNARAEIGQRLIALEPMSIVLNFGMSNGFQKPDFKNLKWPVDFKIDYVRVYQPVGEENYGCDPVDFPTAKYIARHSEAYNNPNLTVWSDYKDSLFPRNRLSDGC